MEKHIIEISESDARLYSVALSGSDYSASAILPGVAVCAHCDRALRPNSGMPCVRCGFCAECCDPATCQATYGAPWTCAGCQLLCAGHLTQPCVHCQRCAECCQCWKCPECGPWYPGHADILLCETCQACEQCCDCWLCEGCDTRYAQDGDMRQCDACEACADCCDCWYCEACDRRIPNDHACCPNCAYCEQCCECWECEGCTERCDEEDYRCDYCELCEQCCECAYCDRGDHRYDGNDYDPCEYCRSCPRCCVCVDERTIRPYTTDVLDYVKFFGTPPDKVWLGVELEVQVDGENRLDVAERWLKKASDWLLLKEDSSIGYGFEIVTAPSDLPTHQERWTTLLGTPTLTRSLRSWDARKHECGLHVHVSRHPITPLQLGKILVFMNSPSTKEYIITIAGRESWGYAKFAPKDLVDSAKLQRNLRDGITRFGQRDRYEAVNLQNPDTIEFRIFKGTLDLGHVLADIQFCHAVVSWCRDCSIQDIESWRAFIDYVRQDKAYKALYAYLVHKDIT